MDKAHHLAKLINEKLLDNNLVKEYQLYEKLISSNPDFKKMEDRLKDYQKKMVSLKYQNDESYNQIFQEYSKLRNEFENNPLINNYLILKEDLNDYLQEINDLINKGLNSD